MSTNPHLFVFPADLKLHITSPFQTNPQCPLTNSNLNLNRNAPLRIKSASCLLPSSHPDFLAQLHQNFTFENSQSLSSVVDICDSFFDIQDRTQEEQPPSPSSFLSPFEEGTTH